jgi:hypothetical protein
MCKILKIIILCKILKKDLTFQKYTVYNISTNKNFMQNLDEYIYEQTKEGQEELAEEREERRKKFEQEMDDADNAWSER